MAAIGVVIVIGALLRFHNLGRESLWFDEALSWSQAKDGLADLFQRTAEGANYNPPLHNLVLFVAIKLFGDAERSLRLPSAIFSVVNMAALYWLGAMTVGRTAGLIGALMLALSPFDIAYSQEARVYTLLSLSATLYGATCFYYLNAPSLPRGVWISLSGLALVYSHPYGTLYWIAIGVTFAVLFLYPALPVQRGTVLGWVVSNIVIAAGFAPWAMILFEQTHERIVVSGFGYQLTPLGVIKTLGAASDKFFIFVAIIGGVLAVIGQLRKDVMLLCAWIVLPAAMGLLLSLSFTPIFIARYLIGSHPALLLITAFGWTRYIKDWRGAILATALVALLSIAALPLLSHPPYANPKDDWRAVASFLEKRKQPTDCVLFVPGYEFVPLDYYYRRSLSCSWGAMQLADLPTKMLGSVLFGLFDFHVGEAADLSRLEAFTDELGRQGWHEVDRRSFRGLLVITFAR